MVFYVYKRYGNWVGVAYLIIHMVYAKSWEKILVTTLLFTLIGALLLLIPNPLMPEVVRKVHFVEVTSSNFLFGLITSWTLLFRSKTAKTEHKAILENA